MTEPTKPETNKPRNRLTDIVVEEVSLVDRAANKHRFLIVKRSDEMDETTNQVSENETGVTDNTDTDEVITDLNEQSDNDAQSDRDSPLSVALAALEGLTETVELLGSIDEQVANTRLGELSGDLKAIADRLDQRTGVKPHDGDAQSQNATDGTTRNADSKPNDPAAAVEAIRATLQRVKTILEQGTKDKPTDDKPGRNASTGDNSISEQLASLSNELHALTSSFKEHQQRLTKLEKRFGIPNSTASNEQRRRPEIEEVGWPLDMNRACDRDSVDKSVSFHDV